jgi:hypothetical protein
MTPCACAEWSASNGAPAMRVPLHVTDERANGDARDIPAFVELFFHDVFLLCNLAAPGSFSGVVSVSGGAYRVNELAFDARVFEYARTSLDTRRLRDVAAYDSLQNGTRQIATNGVAKALASSPPPRAQFRGRRHDGHPPRAIGRGFVGAGEPLIRLRDAIARGATPVLHPMADDALDPRSTTLRSIDCGHR